MRKILIVVDMQNDFIDGALGTPEAQAILTDVVNVIKTYEEENIIATRDTHPEWYMETQEGKNLPVIHCVQGTYGWELNPDVANALEGAEVIDKPTFGSTQLAERLVSMAKQEKLEITLVGLCTDICVVSNALLIKAFLPEIQVNVIASCCAGVTPESHEAALKTMAMCQIRIL